MSVWCVTHRGHKHHLYIRRTRGARKGPGSTSVLPSASTDVRHIQRNTRNTHHGSSPRTRPARKDPGSTSVLPSAATDVLAI
jgi:hypothetical protein